LNNRPEIVEEKSNQAFEPGRLLFWLLLIGLAGFAVSGIRAIPFHPDESTYLFMSSDFDLLVRDPGAIVWKADGETDLRQRYRELDAPLTRYILGFGRTIAGLPPLMVDWKWSASWAENLENGAVPEPALLFAGRLAVTLLLLLSLTFIYLSGKVMGGTASGLAAMFILGSSALVLLHGRRAMAEGALLFGVSLAIWGFLNGHRLPWLAGLGMALAFNAKQSTIALLPVGLLAVGWLPWSVTPKIKKILTHLVIFSLVFIGLTFLLNPLLWSNPLRALQASWTARTDLLNRQVSDMLASAPEQVLRDPGQRAAVLIANLYLQPLSFYEVGNYRDQTAEAEAAYLANPYNRLFRGPGWGVILLTLTIAGIVLGALTIVKYRPEKHLPDHPLSDCWQRRRALMIVFLASIFQFGGLLAAVPLPFQRYVFPLIPFVCLWSGFGLHELSKALIKQR
jgi:4-amino-4-deoxy-L-arabinose transferase-like glycosyltransferase